MKIGLQLTNFAWPGAPATIAPTLSAIAKRAEEAGFDSLWVIDHFFQDPNLGRPEDPMLESYSTLSFLAAQTSRIELGVMVTGVTYRHPGILLKTVTTLDVLSGGRAWLGIGAAWYEREHLGLGVPFPSPKERFEGLEETLQIAHLIWSGEIAQYNGKHYHLTETINSPQAIRKPHPPIVVGGSGEKKTLRLVAKYADACCFFARAGDDTLRRKLDILKSHCQAEGRPYDTISKMVIANPQATCDPSGSLSPQQTIDHAAHLSTLGFDYYHVSLPNVNHPAFAALRDEIIPAVHLI